MLRREFQSRLGKLMPNDPFWLEDRVESLRQIIAGQTVYEAHNTITKYIEIVKCHLTKDHFKGWESIGYTEPVIAEPVAGSRPTLTLRNIKKYEEELPKRWTRDGRRYDVIAAEECVITTPTRAATPITFYASPWDKISPDPSTGSSKLNGSSDVFTRTRGAI